MVAFMRDHVLPAETTYAEQAFAGGPDDHRVPAVIEDLKRTAREQGLWNLFLPHESGLTQLEYAPIAELSGWSNDLGPEAINCQAPDTATWSCCTCSAPRPSRSAGCARCSTARSARPSP